MAVFADAKIGVFFVVNSVLQLTIGVLAFLDAAQTSELKRKWFAKASIWGRTPLHTKVVGIVFLITSAIPTIAGAIGAWGFRKSPRAGIDVALSLNTILVPFVQIMTLTRLSRRILRTTKENEEVLSKRSGVLRPRTIHGQELPVHFCDVETKAQLLHYLQQLQIMRPSEDDDVVASRLHDGLHRSMTPAQVFAVGLLRSKQSSPPTYWTLMSSVLQIDRQGAWRLIASLISIVARCAATASTFSKPATMTSTEALVFNMFAPAFLAASVLVGIWYEKWALQLSSTPGRRCLETSEKWIMLGTWILLQGYLWGITIKNLALGCFFCHLKHVQLIYAVQWIAELHETVANEAWIVFQRTELGACEVPSWAELETRLREFADDEAGLKDFEKLQDSEAGHSPKTCNAEQEASTAELTGMA